MKPTRNNIAKRYTNSFITITKLSLGLFVVCFITYTEFFAQNDEQELRPPGKAGRMSSVSMVNGHYKVDTAIIWSERNWLTLLEDLGTENLADKKTKAEIPEFIRAFLDSISPGKKFDIANPGEKWWAGDIKDMVFTSIYDQAKQDSLCVLSCNKNGLPGKQLVYCGVGKNMALLSWYVAGARLSQCTALIKFKDKTVIDFWFKNSPSLSATKYEILKSIERKEGC
jgi:hypothetical protein